MLCERPHEEHGKTKYKLWENVSHIFEEGLVSTIYKECSKLNWKKKKKQSHEKIDTKKDI